MAFTHHPRAPYLAEYRLDISTCRHYDFKKRTNPRDSPKLIITGEKRHPESPSLGLSFQDQPFQEMTTLTTDTAAPTNPQTISNENGTHDIEQGPDSYNTTDLSKAAHREGFIYIDDLVVVFACETGFTGKHLPGLWKKFGCERRIGPIGELSNQSQRFKRWFTVLYRLAFGFVNHPVQDDLLFPGPYKKAVKKHIRYEDRYQPADLGHFKQNGYVGCYLALNDLRDYLTGYAEIPYKDLPGSLFQPVVISEESTGQGPGATEIKKSPDQQPETPKEKTQWETMADWIKTNHPDEWGRFADKCSDPDKPETGARPHYWNREKWCRIISLQKRLADPEHFKKPKDVYNHMLTDKKLRPHLLKTDRLRQKIKIENTEAGAYDLKQFKKWTRDVWPDEFFKKGREKK